MDHGALTPLPRRVVWGYGLPAFALALFGVPVYVHLPKFYADVAGAPLEALGLAILVTRAWDGLLDPIVGAWSDRTRTRWGRRRPFIAGAALPLAVAVVALFSPAATGTAAVWWFAGSMSLAFTAWTAIQIPHQALGAELAAGHHQRTTLFAVRDGLWIAGTLAAAIAPAALRAWQTSGEAPPDERAVFQSLGLLYATLLLVLPWWCVASVTEPAPPDVPPVRPALRTMVRAAWGNRPYRVLIGAYAVAALGGALPGTLLFFYVEHVLGAPAWGDGLLALYFLAAFAGLPGWTWAAARLGKARTFRLATLLSVLVFACALLLGRGDAPWFALISALSGLGFGATLTLPASMLADTLDYEEARTGARQEGLLVGLWGVTMKGAAAAGAGVALPALGWAGYAPGAPPGPEAVWAIRLLYCGVPCVCYLLALAAVRHYPIDERVHRRILLARDHRRAGGLPQDPLDELEDMNMISP